MPFEHYQLTEYQHKSLVQVANGKTPLVFTIEINPDDDEATVARLDKQEAELRELAQLGLLKDVTGSLAEHIASTKLQSGRGYKAFMITNTGYDMFYGPRKPTTH